MSLSESCLPELMPALNSLSRADKLRLIQHLIVDLAQDEGIPLADAGAVFPEWTPLEAYDAAETLLIMLDEAEVSP